MKKIKITLSLLFLFIATIALSQTIHHALHVDLDITDQSIEVIDTVTIPVTFSWGAGELVFSLNKNLVPGTSSAMVDIREIAGETSGSLYKKYTLSVTDLGEGDAVIPITYSGKITDEIATGADEYARGFSSTNGIISDAGVYLAGSTYWIPSFEEALLSFDLTVTLRSDWSVVSQGERIINTVHGDKRIISYVERNPTEEVYLIAAAWTEYEQKVGEVLVQAFLRTPDQDLASRYLDATSGYLNMYVSLIGPYPYTKFALVENFWETGFGMPSFTLLGEKIIRFPWILTTSYPHELLHNWWGNSVYVDFSKGNWCEGLTAYMADHLLKEQAGQGADYRRTTLQKYTDYVNPENDFPVMEFRSRNNSAEEAIGYGKCLMFNHMLRKSLGDEAFIQGYQRFYKDNLYKIATFDDIQESFREFSQNDLGPFFDQWLLRKGAPSFELSDVRSEQAGEGYDLHFMLSQTQAEGVFQVDIPVAVYMENSVELVEVISDKRANEYTLRLPAQPVRIEVDPRFDVFRRLDNAEVPPSLSQIFGSSDGLIILPQNSPFMDAYTDLAATWKATQQAQGKSLQVIWDGALETIPDHASAWVIGFENKFAGEFNVRNDYATAFSTEQSDLITALTKEGSVVYAIPNPGNNAFTVGFIGTNVKEAVPGLTRLLTHYGKYSFLGFEGERPNNVLKGNFPAINSPLFFSIPHAGEYMQPSAVLAPEKALAQ